jgi:hypothetical protein
MPRPGGHDLRNDCHPGPRDQTAEAFAAKLSLKSWNFKRQARALSDADRDYGQNNDRNSFIRESLAF